MNCRPRFLELLHEFRTAIGRAFNIISGSSTFCLDSLQNNMGRRPRREYTELGVHPSSRTGLKEVGKSYGVFRDLSTKSLPVDITT